MNSIDVACININGLNSDLKVDFLSNILATNQVIFIQETWSTNYAIQLASNKNGFLSNPTELKGRGGKNDGLLIISNLLLKKKRLKLLKRKKLLKKKL